MSVVLKSKTAEFSIRFFRHIWHDSLRVEVFHDCKIKYPLIQEPTLQACSAKKDYLFLNLLQLQINIYLLSSSQNKEETPQNSPSKESVWLTMPPGNQEVEKLLSPLPPPHRWVHTHTDKTCSIYHKLYSKIRNADRISNHLQKFMKLKTHQAGLWVSFFLNRAILLTYQQCL